MASSLIVYSEKNDGRGIYLPKSKQTYRLRNKLLFDQIFIIFDNAKNSIIFNVKLK